MAHRCPRSRPSGEYEGSSSPGLLGPLAAKKYMRPLTCLRLHLSKYFNRFAQNASVLLSLLLVSQGDVLDGGQSVSV